jgi:hypothetical protein
MHTDVSDRPVIPELTICAADSVFLDQTVRALEISMSQCDFSDAILFSDVPRQGSFRHVPIARLESLKDYSRFILRELSGHIQTSHILIIQWDGYVVDAGAWRRSFLKYDYVGAVWPQEPEERAVGNGGFSLRSRRLMEAVAQMEPVPGFSEDVVIGRFLRPALERQMGFRFAPTKIARQFSYELAFDEKQPTFGFHGVENLYRYCSDDELAKICAPLDVSLLHPEKVLVLAINCLEAGQHKSAGILYTKLKAERPLAVIARVLRDLFGEELGSRRFAALSTMQTA